MTVLEIGAVPLSIARLCRAVQQGDDIQLTQGARDRLAHGRAAVDAIVQSGVPVYGVNTGVGSQKDYTVSAQDARDYNRRLIRAHGTRIPGPTAAPEVVRATLIVLINELSHGMAGVSPQLIEGMINLANTAPMPQIDTSGSVGASDLVPLAQLAEWVLSHPTLNGTDLPQAKDALCLINSNAFSLATGAMAIDSLGPMLRGFELAAALSYEGFRCNIDAISPEVAQATRRTGQQSVAANMRALLHDSALHLPTAARFLQDPLSFRNAAQVLGAASEAATWVSNVWEDELGSVAGNPLVAIGDKPAYSHGNMDTTRMTLAIDMMRQSLAKVADVAAERVHKQQWPAFSGLPAGLAQDADPAGGVQFLNLGHITSSLVTSMKIWAHPHLLASVGQVADGVEDTAGNAAHAVHDMARQIDAGFKIAALEAAIAVWAIHRRAIAPRSLGHGLRAVYNDLLGILPVGSEGQTVFDLAPVVACFRTHLARST